jgi:hypothetical protein
MYVCLILYNGRTKIAEMHMQKLVLSLAELKCKFNFLTGMWFCISSYVQHSCIMLGTIMTLLLTLFRWFKEIPVGVKLTKCEHVMIHNRSTWLDKAVSLIKSF